MLTIYKASAGSGKTFTLAYEYIKTLLTDKIVAADGGHGPARYVLSTRPQSKHRHILAITFTNMATEEMKSRIIDELNAIWHTAATPKPSKYAEQLLALTGCQPQALAEAARKALEHLLYDFHFFNVSTIDSFFQLVLRTFAREVDRPEDFEIELNDNSVISMAIDQMFQEITYSPETTKDLRKWIIEYMTQITQEGDDFNIFNRKGRKYKQLVDFVASSINEAFKDKGDQVAAYLSDLKRLSRYMAALNKRIRALTQQHLDAVAALKAAVSAAPGVAACFSRYPKGHLENLINDNLLPLDTIGSTKEPKYIQAGLEDPAALLSTVTPQAVEVAQAMCQVWVTYIEKVSEGGMLAQIRSNIGRFGMLGFVMAAIERFRKENNIILLSDTNELLRKIISTDDTPFVYERLGVELNHFLIDEFQDTSSRQWENLSPLLHNSLSFAQDYDSLIIGDEKQSIYRWRNADASLLHEQVPRQFPEPLGHVMGQSPEENTNWRSAPDIVRFNNTLFRNMAHEQRFDIYDNVTQSISEKHSREKAHILVEEIDAPNAKAYNEEIMTRIADDLRQWHAQGYGWGEMAILARRGRELQDIITYLLANAKDIPLVSNEAMRLTESAAIKVIISILQILEECTIEQGHALTNRQIELRLGQMEYLYSSGSGIDLSEAVSRIATQDEIKPEIIEKILAERSTNLTTLIQHIITYALPEEIRATDRAFIIAFNDVVADFCQRYSANLHTFIKWWETNGDNLSIPAGERQDSVTLLTIHKAKGLQYKCVLIPMANWALTSPSKDEQWWPGRPIPNVEVAEADIPPLLLVKPFAKGISDPGSPFFDDYKNYFRQIVLDNFNLAYVAFTRAERELHVYLQPNNRAATIGDYIVRALSTPTPELTDDPALHLDFEPYRQITTVAVSKSTTRNLLTLEVGEPIDRFAELAAEAAERARRAHDDDDETAIAKPETVPFDLPEAYTPLFPAEIASIVSDPDEAADPLDPVSLCDSDGDELEGPAPLPGGLSPAEWGELLHRATSMVERAPQLEGVVQRLKHDLRLAPNVEAYLRQALEATVNADNPLVRQWFNDYDYIISERPIYAAGAERTWRPDRVVWLPDGHVHVVDFKFGAKHSKKYYGQVCEYMQLLRSMGHLYVEGYLYYPLVNQIEKVTI